MVFIRIGAPHRPQTKSILAALTTVQRDRINPFRIRFYPKQPLGLRFTTTHRAQRIIQVHGPHVAALDRVNRLIAINTVNVSTMASSNELDEWIQDMHTYPKLLHVVNADHSMQLRIQVMSRRAMDQLTFKWVDEAVVPVPMICAVRYHQDIGAMNRPDGILPGQLIKQVNGISTYGASLIEVMEGLAVLEPYERELTVEEATTQGKSIVAMSKSHRDASSGWLQVTGLGRQEIQTPVKGLPKVMIKTAQDDTIIEEHDGIQVVSSVNSPFVANIFDFIHRIVVNQGSISKPVRHSQVPFYAHRIDWEHLNLSDLDRVIQLVQLDVLNNDLPVGIAFETDFRGKHAVVRSFRREPSPAKRRKMVRVGDLILSINNEPVERIPTDRLVAIITGEENLSR